MTKLIWENSGKSQLYELLFEWWHTADVCQSSDIVIRDLEKRIKDLVLLEEEEYIGDYGPSEGYVEGWNHYREILLEKLEVEND
jgi:hypothetical protein